MKTTNAMKLYGKKNKLGTFLGLLIRKVKKATDAFDKTVFFKIMKISCQESSSSCSNFLLCYETLTFFCRIELAQSIFFSQCLSIRGMDLEYKDEKRTCYSTFKVVQTYTNLFELVQYVSTCWKKIRRIKYSALFLRLVFEKFFKGKND